MAALMKDRYTPKISIDRPRRSISLHGEGGISWQRKPYRAVSVLERVAPVGTQHAVEVDRAIVCLNAGMTAESRRGRGDSAILRGRADLPGDMREVDGTAARLQAHVDPPRFVAQIAPFVLLSAISVRSDQWLQGFQSPLSL